MPDTIDLTLIKKHLEKKYNLKEQQQNKLITVTAQSVRESLEAAEKAFADSDMEALAEYTHKLKGTLLIIALPHWAEKVDAIHYAAEQGMMLDYKTELRELRTGLRVLCEMDESETAPEIGSL